MSRGYSFGTPGSQQQQPSWGYGTPIQAQPQQQQQQQVFGNSMLQQQPSMPSSASSRRLWSQSTLSSQVGVGQSSQPGQVSQQTSNTVQQPFSLFGGGYNSASSSQQPGPSQYQQQQQSGTQQGFPTSDNMATSSSTAQSNTFGGFNQQSMYGNQQQQQQSQPTSASSSTFSASNSGSQRQPFNPNAYQMGVPAIASPVRQRSLSTASPEQVHREIGSNGPRDDARNARMFGSIGSSGSGGGRASPRRSPRKDLPTSHRDRAYARQARNVSTYADTSPGGVTADTTLMDEDAPRVAMFDEYEDINMSADASSPQRGNGQRVDSPPTTGLPLAPGRSLTSMLNGNASSASDGQSVFKIVVFGFAPQSRQAILAQFATFGDVAYSAVDPSGGSAEAESGSNWATIGYKAEASALRALQQNGIVVEGTMIGVRWASSMPQAQQGGPVETRSGSPSSRGTNGQGAPGPWTPAAVRPATEAWPVQRAQANQLAKANASSRFNLQDAGKVDASIFKEQPQQSQQQKGGIINTVSNLIFGF